LEKIEFLNFKQAQIAAEIN